MKPLILCFIVATLAVSCKKDDSNNNPIPANSKVKTHSFTSSSYSYQRSFTYDASGRLTLLQEGVAKETYAYAGNKVTYKRYSSPGYLADSTVYTLVNGYADTAIETTAIGSITRYKYKYDAAGHLVEEREYSSTNELTQRDIYTYQNDNLVLEEVQDAWGATIDSDTYTYDVSKLSSLSYDAAGVSFLGKTSKNVRTSFTNGGQIYTMHYGFDASNRITSIATKNSSGTTLATEAFTYY